MALTSTVKKTFEHLVKQVMTTNVVGQVNPLQFAYQAHRGVDDATVTLLNDLYKHLEGTKPMQDFYLWIFPQLLSQSNPTSWERNSIFFISLYLHFVKWCDNHLLKLNVTKTKDMAIDF